MCWLVLVCPVVSVGGGGEPGEGLVWPVVVVFGSPVLEHDSGFEEVGEVLGVEAFVSEASVEGLDVGVLPGRSGLDVGGVGAPDAAPVSQRGRDELGAVVHAQMSGGASLGDEALDGGDDAVGVDAVRRVDAEGLSGELVDDVEQLDAAQVGGLVELEIQGPTRRWGVGRAAERRCRL